jgi:hypothetical protein
MSEVEFTGKFGWGNLSLCDCAQLQKELAIFETEKLSVLRRKRWVKLIPLSDMTAEAQRELAALNRDDPEGLWQLHLAYGKWRVWGQLEGHDFFLFLWDRDHGIATGKTHRRKT